MPDLSVEPRGSAATGGLRSRAIQPSHKVRLQPLGVEKRTSNLRSQKRDEKPEIGSFFFCRFAPGSAPACGSKEESVQHR